MNFIDSDAFENALSQFETYIQEADLYDFQRTTLTDVWEAARVIERDREQHKRMRSQKRIEIFLQKLGILGDVAQKIHLDVTKAPVKLLLQTTNENDECFGQIINACSQIGQCMPLADQIQVLVHTECGSASVVLNICKDLLDFHARTYGLIRRGAWSHLFLPSWNQFQLGFRSILRRLDQSRQLAEKQAERQALLRAASNEYGTTYAIGNAQVHQGNIYNMSYAHPELLQAINQSLTEAKHARERWIADLNRQQEERSDRALRESLDWLQLEGHDQTQQSLFDRRSEAREEDTCNWILNHTDFLNWLDRDHRRKYLWLEGKPGSGKTTLATFIAEKARFPDRSLVLSFLCVQNGPHALEACSLTFRSLIAQILQRRPALVPFIYEDYVKKAEVLSLRKVVPLLKILLTSEPSTYLILDGLDECNKETQQMLLKKLEFFQGNPNEDLENTNSALKVLICSRDTGNTPPKLRKEPTISLRKESKLVSRDIKLYTLRKIAELRDRFTEPQVDEVASEIVNKANGMFLWVRLVLSTILDQHSLEDLQNTVHHLPKGLKGLYRTILSSIEQRSDKRQARYIRNTLTWLTFARRPLKTYELCDAIMLSHPAQQLNERTKLGKGVLDYCKPLLEELPDQTVSFIHFSVREFLLSEASGPYLSADHGPGVVASACLHYLLSCESFFTADALASTYRDIVLGLHNLFPYVSDHWDQHLIAMLNPANESSDHKLGFEASRSTPDSESQPPVTPSFNQQELRIWVQIELQRGSAPQRNMYENLAAKSIVALLDTILAEVRHGKLDTSIEAQNPNAINRAYQRFRMMFEKILCHECPFPLTEMQVTESQISNFFSDHAAAFRCTWAGCPRSVDGFSSLHERQKHVEKHLNLFCCLEPDCEFFNTTLANRAALRRHIAKYHTVLTEVALPVLKTSRPRRQPTIETELRWDAGYKTVGRSRPPATISSAEQLQQEQRPGAAGALDGKDWMRTPSPAKKKLSLGDYMSRRKESSEKPGTSLPGPADSRKEWTGSRVRERVKNAYPVTALPSSASPVPNANLSLPNAADEEEYTIKCICGYNDDDGNTVFCEKCDTWQHIECYYHGKKLPEIHFCTDCAPTDTFSDINAEKARERQRRIRESAKPDSEYLQAVKGRMPLPHIIYKGDMWKVGDWIHIQNPNDITKPIIAQIYRTWKTANDEEWINACWYYRPEQTVHQYEKHFYPNEVVKTGQYRDHKIEEVLNKCFVMFCTRYSRGQPRNLPADIEIYVCEARYNEDKFKFNKIKTWASCLPDEVRDKDYEMDLFDAPRKVKKVPSPLLSRLKDAAKDADELPQPEWKHANAPPLVGGIHKRPRDENQSPPPEPTPPPQLAPPAVVRTPSANQQINMRVQAYTQNSAQADSQPQLVRGRNPVSSIAGSTPRTSKREMDEEIARDILQEEEASDEEDEDGDNLSSDESIRPAKRKAHPTDDEDYIRNNPDLFGLRRSGRARPSRT